MIRGRNLLGETERPLTRSCEVERPDIAAHFKAFSNPAASDFSATVM